MTSLVTVKKEIEKIKQKTQLKPKRKDYIKVWLSDCLIVDRNRVVDTRIDDRGRKWAAILVEKVKQNV